MAAILGNDGHLGYFLGRMYLGNMQWSYPCKLWCDNRYHLFYYQGVRLHILMKIEAKAAIYNLCKLCKISLLPVLQLFWYVVWEGFKRHLLANMTCQWYHFYFCQGAFVHILVQIMAKRQFLIYANYASLPYLIFSTFLICCLGGFQETFAEEIISVAVLSRSNHRLTRTVP